MRRFVITLSVLLVGVINFAYAQHSHNVDYNDLMEQVNRSNRDISNPKRAMKPKTWLKRADLMLDVHRSYTSKVLPGMDMNALLLVAGNPVKRFTDSVKGGLYDVMSYPRVDFYFHDNKYVFYKITAPIMNSPLDSSMVALIKGMKVDERKKKTEKFQEGFTELRVDLENDAANAFMYGDYAHAVHDFRMVESIYNMNIIDNKPDSMMFYNLALAEFLNQEYAKSAEHFKRSIEVGYQKNGEAYCNYYEAVQKAKINDDEVQKLLLSGIEKFPMQECIIQNLITYYILNNKDPKSILKYVNRAIATAPDRPDLYFIRGMVYSQLNDNVKSEESYREAIKKKPDYAFAYYNISAMHYNEAVRANNEAVKLPARGYDRQYDSLTDMAKMEFHKCIAPAEKAVEIDPNYAEALDLLKAVYFRFRSEPGVADKLKSVQEKLKELGK